MILGERKKKSLTTFTGTNLSLSIPPGMMLHATFFLLQQAWEESSWQKITFKAQSLYVCNGRRKSMTASRRGQGKNSKRGEAKSRKPCQVNLSNLSRRRCYGTASALFSYYLYQIVVLKCTTADNTAHVMQQDKS